MEEEGFERPMPDFQQLLMQKIASKQSTSEATPTSTFDPYKMMVNKKKTDDGSPVDTTNTVKWPEKDVKAFEDFCKKYNVIGFNCGQMSPVAALALLKNMMGITDKPLEERVPQGYETLATKPKFNPNFPYESAMKEKTLLKG